MLANLMRHKITVTRGTFGKDSSGGITETDTDVYANVPAFVQPVSSTAVFYYAQYNTQVTHTVFVNKNLTILNGDSITFGSRSFVVIGVRNVLESGLFMAIDTYEFLE